MKKRRTAARAADSGAAGEKAAGRASGPADRVTRGLLALPVAAVLVAATFAAHFPAVLADYTWDDDQYLYQSPLTLARDGLYRIWFTTEATDYWPLTRTTFWLEWRVWGNNPMPYHVANIALHALAAVLLWRVLKRLNVPEVGAFLAGLIFALHPVTVESVAWISELKTVLSMVLYLLSILAYLQFEDQDSRRWYVYALLAGAGALLAKTSVAMLPVVLLLCTWWRRGKLTRRDILRTLPFFALSLAIGLVTVWVEHNRSMGGAVVRPEGLASRIAASGWIAWFYLYKILLPINLVTIYPRWEVDSGHILSFAPLALLLACLAMLWGFRKSWGRAPLAAMGYFVITLGPVLGFVDIDFMRYSLVADHLQYLAMPGIIALLGGCLGTAASRARRSGSGVARGGSLAVIAGIVVLLATLTWRQASTYRNEETQWTHTIALNDRAWIAYRNRASAYISHGDFDRAIRDCTRAIELKPDYMDAYYHRGLAYQRLRDFGAAIRDYTKAIEVKKDSAIVYNNRAVTYFSLGEYDKAWADVETCRQLGGKPHPDFVQALTEAMGRPRQR